MAKYSNDLEDNLNLTSASVSVLESRYLMKNENREIIETGIDMFRRVANDIALADKFYDKKADYEKSAENFYQMMANLDFLPNSPTLMNAGGPLQQLSACFVLPIGDSMEEIAETQKNTILIHKSGGGTGFSFSNLRPNGAYIKGTNSTTPGAISFLFSYNSSTNTVIQGGKRRGANMGVLKVDHPDIFEFVTAKNLEGALKNFNLSVGITDEFIDAYYNDGYIQLKDPREGVDYTIDQLNKKVPLEYPGPGEYVLKPVLIEHGSQLFNTRTKEIVGEVKEKKLYVSARKLLDFIVTQAWTNGEPGVVFLDRINKANPTPEIGKIESTNPCGEQPLLAYESCNLGSINLGNFVKDKKIDYERLENIVTEAVHFLDNVIDRNKYPLSKIEEVTKNNRKIGLGVMGFADMLIKLGISYNSEEALKKAEKVMSFIQKKAKKTSEKLAEKRGTFPNYDESIYKGKVKLRHATETTIAPTGTIGVIAGASQGIEPLFMISYKRQVKESIGKDLLEVSPVFEGIAKKRGFYSKELLEKIIENKGSLRGIKEIPKDIQDLFIIANDVPIEQHIKIQAAFQKYVDNAVSKTNNLPNSAKVEDIKKTFLFAYEQGCKGITIYRDGSREKQLIVSAQKEIEYLKLSPLEKIINSKTMWKKTACGTTKIIIGYDEKKHPIDIEIKMGKSGGCLNALMNALGSGINLTLRYGIHPQEIVDQFKGIKCDRTYGIGQNRIWSCSDLIAKTIEEFIEKFSKKLPKNKYITPSPREFIYPGKTTKIKTRCGHNFITLNYDKGNNPREIFVVKGKSGGCLNAMNEALGRITSLILRCDGDPNEIIKAFKGEDCSAYKGDKGKSCPTAIADVIEMFLHNGEKQENAESLRLRCKNCGAELKPGGCREGMCYNCFWSPCD